MPIHRDNKQPSMCHYNYIPPYSIKQCQSKSKQYKHYQRTPIAQAVWGNSTNYQEKQTKTIKKQPKSHKKQLQSIPNRTHPLLPGGEKYAWPFWGCRRGPNTVAKRCHAKVPAPRCGKKITQAPYKKQVGCLGNVPNMYHPDVSIRYKCVLYMYQYVCHAWVNMHLILFTFLQVQYS